jgi:hypothetical protein
MARFIRFVVHQRITRERRRVGLFTAADYLRSQGELTRHDDERLASLLALFETELTVPPRGAIPSQALFWYGDDTPFSRRMWELAQALHEYDLSAELITAKYVGKIVYRDRHQFAALPPSRRRLAV